MKPFYLGISQNTSVDTKSIIGIFDMDTSTISPDTRSFLRVSQANGRLISKVTDIPKSFVLTSDSVYLSQLSSQTLYGRLSEDID